MNRPRNRQPRPPRGGQAPSRGCHRGGSHRGSHNNGSNNSRPAYTSVPSIEQVIPGSSVSIVLKQDQPTGREVQGIVQDLLTRGNHPRGIKVRLSDGRVGRVQRMVGDGTVPKTTSNEPGAARGQMTRDSRDEASEGPSPRTLADYIRFPSDDDAGNAPAGTELGFTTATARCPICNSFEGDEIAVSRHVEEHLT